MSIRALFSNKSSYNRYVKACGIVDGLNGIILGDIYTLFDEEGVLMTKPLVKVDRDGKPLIGIVSVGGCTMMYLCATTGDDGKIWVEAEEIKYFKNLISKYRIVESKYVRKYNVE
jgi:hypothetical protein